MRTGSVIQVVHGGQREVDAGSTHRVAKPDTAAVRLDDRLAQHQTEAKAVSLGGRERKKLIFRDIGWEARTIVGDADFNEPLAGGGRFNQNFAAADGSRLERVDRIADEVEQRLLDLQRIDQ